MKLKFCADFPFSGNTSFFISVCREGNDSMKHDQSLVDTLNSHGLNSKLLTAAAFGARNIETGQSCFGGGYYGVPAGYTKQDVKLALAKLNGMTPQEVAAIYTEAGGKIHAMIENLKNDLHLEIAAKDTPSFSF